MSQAICFLVKTHDNTQKPPVLATPSQRGSVERPDNPQIRTSFSGQVEARYPHPHYSPPHALSTLPQRHDPASAQYQDTSNPSHSSYPHRPPPPSHYSPPHAPSTLPQRHDPASTQYQDTSNPSHSSYPHRPPPPSHYSPPHAPSTPPNVMIQLRPNIRIRLILLIPHILTALPRLHITHLLMPYPRSPNVMIQLRPNIRILQSFSFLISSPPSPAFTLLTSACPIHTHRTS
ncbi:hypothetical protein BGW80DRAFT_221717 [Lactifluus volemus]|nr:hypothetical protein BGW80DRAFT_221717 [Lactifluus volemus]